jgi:hypothetical protein
MGPRAEEVYHPDFVDHVNALEYRIHEDAAAPPEHQASSPP